MEETLRNIADLQRKETALYLKLNASPDDVALAEQINDLTQLRETMYDALSDTIAMQTTQSAALDDTLVQQKAVVELAEDELNALKKRDNLMRDNRRQNLRMIEINTYYSKKYAAQSHTLKLAAMGLAIAVAVVALFNFFDGVSKSIRNGLLTVLGVVMVWVVGRRVLDMLNRSSTNYDRYAFFFDKTGAPSASSSTSSSSSSSTDDASGASVFTATTAQCVGADCCAPGTQYEDNQCLPP
jgi:hypothetical protein